MPKASKKLSILKNGRGVGLTTFLAIVTVGAVYALIQQISSLLTMPITFHTFEGLALIILTTAAILMMWLWKKWGVYLYGLVILLIVFLPPLQAASNGLPSPSSYEYFVLVVTTAIIFAILYFIIHPKWSKFS